MNADLQDVHFVVFSVEGQRHAIELGRVARVFHAVEVTPLPGAPAVVEGVVYVHGTAVPAVSMRKRLGLPLRPLALADHFLLVRSAARSLLLITDEVCEVIPLPRSLVMGGDAGRGFVSALVQRDDGPLRIGDVDRLLDRAEAAQLASVLPVPAAGAVP